MDAMRCPWRRTALLGIVAALACGAGTEARGQYPRRTPIVEAVQKTRSAIVTVKVEKRSGGEVIGTGILIDERGYVVTNRHVIAGNRRIVAYLTDGAELAASVLLEDAAHDLALLQVRRPEGKFAAFPTLAFAPAGDLMVGETVIAVGHPFGYRNTVSTGIISAVGREVTLPDGTVLRNLIQTSASINPGNSGGPLLNINGELIGINVALRDGAQGIAFALNADAVQQVLSRQLSGRASVRPGFTCHEIPDADGAWRQHVVVDLVQEPAGQVLQPGDVILQLAGKWITNRFDVQRALWDRKAGEQIRIRLRRHDQQVEVSLKLSPAPDLISH
jgi:serine protease Do